MYSVKRNSTLPGLMITDKRGSGKAFKNFTNFPFTEMHKNSSLRGGGIRASDLKPSEAG